MLEVTSPRTRLFLLVLAACFMPGVPGVQARPDGGLTQILTPLSTPVPAPDFTLKDMDENTHTLSDYRGRVVVINFWAVWCPPCRKEMPSLERLRQHFEDAAFAILAVNEGENTDRIQPFLWELEPAPTFTVLLDDKLTAAREWGIRGLPTSFVVDKQGRIVYRAVGGREFDHPDIVARIQELLDR